jgi:hypothetical protein
MNSLIMSSKNGQSLKIKIMEIDIEITKNLKKSFNLLDDLNL